MKSFTRFLALALCLCLLPVFSMAASDTATEYEVAGITYYVPANWDGPIVDDIYTYFYLNGQDNPLDGFLMVMDLSDPAIANSGYTDEVLMQGTLESLASSMGSEVTSEDLDVNGHAGKYFSGSVMGLLFMSGYITIVDSSRVVAIVLAAPAADDTAIRGTLYEVLGITAE